MNCKKATSTLLFCVMLLGTLAILPSVANALDSPKCKIVKIGCDPRFEGPPIQLVDTRGIDWTGARQFYLSESLGNQGLAVLLTAYSMGKTVWVRIAGDASPGSLITVIFVND